MFVASVLKIIIIFFFRIFPFQSSWHIRASTVALFLQIWEVNVTEYVKQWKN